MEELLLKTILDDTDIVKLTPNYTPSNLLLRIQTRSTMVKDTHSHKKGDSFQRKTIKRPKECFKFEKEIVKICTGFDTMNLKNQIMVKNAVRLVDTLKSDDIIKNSDEVFHNNGLRKEEEIYLQEISQMNLTIQNDSEFKLADKPAKQKVNPKDRNLKKSQNRLYECNTSEGEQHDSEFNINEILKVKCTKLEFPDLPVEPVQEEIAIHETVTMKNSNESHDNLNSSFLHNEHDTKELQELLVMMRISPKFDDQEIKPKPLSASDKTVEEVTHTYTNINLEIISQTAQFKDISDVLNVTQMRIDITSRQEALLKKYVSKWRMYTVKKREEQRKQRDETLNCFFDKLAKRKMSLCETPESPTNKSKFLARDYNRYRHRYQMQKHIIALQKAKLEEQNRIIEELKYKRIVEASKMSVDTLKDEVRRTYYDIDKNLKPKLKTLTNELKIEIEEPALVLHCLKVPQFLQRMEKRAREREEKHAMIRERRKQMEEERIRLKQQEELAKEQMDKEEKLKRIQEQKDKRRREKIENIRKKQHVERMRALTVMADLHYEKALKIKYAIRPLRMLLVFKRENDERAKEHYMFQLKKNVFLNWMWYTEDMIFERNYKATDFYRKKLLGRCFEALKKNHRNLVLKKQVADDYYDLFITNLVFRKFREAIGVAKRENELKWQKAVLYHDSNLVFRSFSCWRTLPALNALKREQEARKARWREKVLQVVPDYTPPED